MFDHNWKFKPKTWQCSLMVVFACLSTGCDIWSFCIKVLFLDLCGYEKKLSFSISNTHNCRENLASMHDKAAEKRQHIRSKIIFSDSCFNFFYCQFIMLIFVQGLDAFLNVCTWQRYHVDHFKHKEKNFKVSRLVQNPFLCKKILVLNRDLFKYINKAGPKIFPAMLALTLQEYIICYNLSTVNISLWP